MDFFPPPVMPETAALTKQVGSLEQRFLLCVLSAFVSIINPNLSDNCPFLLLEGNRLSLLSRLCQNKIFFFFQLLQAMLKLWKATFSLCTCSSWPTVTAKSGGWNLILFWGHAQMAAYHSRRNKREFSMDLDLNTFFIRMMKARLKIDYNLYSTTTNVEEFKSRWCFGVENDLMSGLISGSFLLLFENALRK